MGYFLVGLGLILILWFFGRLFYLSFIKRYNRIIPETEKVDAMEGGAIVNQQRFGRELNRRAVVEIPNRDLSFEEQLEIWEIYSSKNPNVILKGFKKALTEGRLSNRPAHPRRE